MKKEQSKLRAYQSLRKQASLHMNNVQEEADSLQRKIRAVAQQLVSNAEETMQIDALYQELLAKRADGSDLSMCSAARQDVERRRQLLIQAQSLLGREKAALLKRQMAAKTKLDSIDSNIGEQRLSIERLKDNRSEEEMQDMFSARQIFLKR